MARYLLSTAVGVLAAVLAVALLGGENPTAATVAGNYSYARGDYVLATIRYLSVEPEQATATGIARRERRAAYLAYNLGNTYLSLGEVDAGVNALQSARNAGHARLSWRASFNLGNAMYEAGRYAVAATHFRDALLGAPANRDAKINLELALSKMRSSSAAAQEPAAPAQSREQQSARILEFIRRREPARPPPPLRSDDAGGY